MISHDAIRPIGSRAIERFVEMHEEKPKTRPLAPFFLFADLSVVSPPHEKAAQQGRWRLVGEGSC